MKLFVWDFHRTLEKGNDLAVVAYSNVVLERNGYAVRLAPEQAALLSGRVWWEYFAFLLPGESVERCKELAAECMKFVDEDPGFVSRYIRPNDFSLEVLARIDGKHCQIVISNCQPGAMRMFLDNIGISGFFPDGHSFGIAGASKKETLDVFLKGKNFDRVVAVGDSAQDMIGGVNYLYAPPGEEFRCADADYRIRDLREVLREL